MSENLEQIEETQKEESQPKSLADLGELTTYIESVIFASTEPVELKSLKSLADSAGFKVTQKDLKTALSDLIAKWDDPNKTIGHGMVLVKTAGGYIFRTADTFAPVLKALVVEKPQKLSPAHLEVLSIVAYRQPVTRIEIEEIRGVDCSNALRKLLNYKLVKILGKSEAIGCPLLYGTTKTFLEFFGLNSLHDMPNLGDYESLEKGKDGEDEAAEKPNSFQDLFEEAQAEFISAETESKSERAVDELEKALGVVKSVNKGIRANPDAIDEGPEKA